MRQLLQIVALELKSSNRVTGYEKRYYHIINFLILELILVFIPSIWDAWGWPAHSFWDGTFPHLRHRKMATSP